MFEVIISHLRTGKVERRTFDTRDEAETYLAWREEKFLTGRGSAKRSMRDIRMEITRREPAAVVTVPLSAAA